MFDCVVCVLDGGGIRSLIQAVLLKEIEDRTEKKITQLADVFAGSSAGAISSALLSTGYNAVDLMKFYTGTPARKIFTKYKLPISFNIFNKCMHDSKYDTSNIDSVLLEKFGNKQLKDINTKLLVTAYDLNTRDSLLFNNFEQRYRELYIRDVVRASSAAPTYFVPHAFSGYLCIDGGLCANNPSLMVYSYLKKFYDNILIVSIGTGSFKKSIKYKDMCVSNPIAFVGNLVDSFLDGNSDSVDHEAEYLLGDNYIRFQLSIPEDCCDLDNVSEKNLQKLVGITKTVIDTVWKDKLDNLIKILVSK